MNEFERMCAEVRPPGEQAVEEGRRRLLTAAREVGCRTLDGGHMAVHQATEAFALITGITPDAERMSRHFRRLVG